CSGLTSIVVEEGNGHYDSRNNCNAIIETETNTLIAGCKNTIIPNGVTSIGDDAFSGCSGLTSITIPDGVTSIGRNAFYGCSGLTSITIPDGLTSIGEGAFGFCSSLTSITLPDGLTSIGGGAFSLCRGLTSITIPDGVTSIGNSAFCICSGLTSITIPESVTSIGESAFSECSGLTSIVVEEGNGHYDSRNNCNAIIETETNTLIAGCENTIIPNGVTSIGNSAFGGCRGLTSITIPDGVTSIGSYAFFDCRGLTSITIPDGVTSIGRNAFYGCSGLTSITIPESVTSIGDYVFANCNALQSVKMLSSTPPAVSEDIFNNCPDTLVIYVPTGAAANYDVDPWNNYQIVEKSCMEDYAIWASDMRTRPTKPITLSVQLNNVNAISDYQFDLALPKGFSIAMDEDDLEMIYLSTERTTERKHTYSYNMLSDSLLRVICYSNSTYTFSGTEGEVLTITLDVATDVADGDYNLMIKNIEMTEPNGTVHKASDYPCKVTVISYTPGDVNDDGNFSVTDVRGIVNMVLAAQVPDDNPAADVNEDGVISVTDVRGAVNLVLNPVAPTALLSPKMRTATPTANMLYIDPFTIAPGEEKEVWVMLNNPDDAFSDIQFDLYLPEGMEVVNDNDGYLIGLGSRTDLRTHNRPEAALQKDGAVRVLCYSDKAETFFGHSGDVIRLTLKASETLSPGIYSLGLKNVELARPDMTNDHLQASTASVSVNGYATGIGSLDAEMERGEVYDLNGRRVLQPGKGVYILNGKKVIIK
ncbi:MAG: leucine-rich repeat protein, partial [Bacteroidaceae bacterium]|nr:leucine-rich repeat protein [Bacteroidaceae bacterium]